MSGNTGLVAAAIDNQPALWVLAVALYGVGDTITTLGGLRRDGTSEGGPVARHVLEVGGIPGMLLLKAGFIGVYFLLWWLLQTPGRFVLPLALVVVGAVVTGWNLAIVLSQVQ